MYRDGEGIAQNHQQAIYWYKRAIEQKNTKAQFELESLCEIAECG